MTDRQSAAFSLQGLRPETVRQQVLHWGSRCSPFLFLDSAGYADPYGRWDWLAAAGSVRTLTSWDALAAHPAGDWLFGHAAYEAYQSLGTFPLQGRHTTDAGWPPVSFFVPEVVVGLERGAAAVRVESSGDAPAALWARILAAPLPPSGPLPPVAFQPALAPSAYLTTVDALREHIAAGDCYEINLCNAREATRLVALPPVVLYESLRQASPAPFAACYRSGAHWMACASPERYLRVEGATVRSQPIKGTARRDADPGADAAIKAALQASPKERAENVMIVDLTRSDLARVCAVGSIRVDELFGIQSFPTVHQLVSTVSGTLTPGATWLDAVKASFPMGSMTGAPKQKVMELIDRYEPVPRGLFSGTVGYVTPAGDADFNVVIRSLFYEETTGCLSYSTGGAITWGSDPAAEWEETLLKGAALERLFGNS